MAHNKKGHSIICVLFVYIIKTNGKICKSEKRYICISVSYLQHLIKMVSAVFSSLDFFTAVTIRAGRKRSNSITINYMA